MDKKYSIKSVHICTFRTKNGFVIPNSNQYPVRLCVIDNENKVAIDVYHQLKYNFIETDYHGQIFNDEECAKIKENKRFAILPIDVVYVGGESKKNCEKALSRLKNGYEFKDGNDVLTNEEFLFITHENVFNKEERKKVKKIERKI